MQIFDNTVLTNSSQVAICFNEVRLTYEEFDFHTQIIASKIQSIYPKIKKQRVIVYLNRSIELHLSIISILKLGCSFVPVDSETPSDRVIEILSESEAALVIVDNLTIKKLEKHKIDSILNIESLSKFDSPQDSLCKIGTNPRDEAYIIFTSGSTGKPKGISISHENLCNFVRSENSILKINSSDKVWQGFSPAFDMFIEETFIALLAGATLEVANSDDIKNLDLIPDRLEKAKVTVLHVVPTLAATFTRDVDSLRLINFGGEACSEIVVKKFSRENRKLFNTYGPTETTVSATISELFPDREITIGKALPNYHVVIFDEHLNQAEVNQKGEILIGGPSVSSGYINRPDLNDAKFIELPFSAERSSPKVLTRFYRTGDCASYSPNGEIIFHGRIDTQIKIRGFRVELEEIEKNINAHPLVQFSAVLVERDSLDMEYLSALIVPDSSLKNVKSSSLNEIEGLVNLKKQLQELLGLKLPKYMIPNSIDFIESMPRLPSGKVDRKTLAKDAKTKSTLAKLKIDNREIKLNSESSTSLYSETEKIVIAQMQRLFPNSEVGIDSNFFTELGGHSLLAALITSEFRKNVNWSSLSISDLYSHPTARTLAAHLDEITQFYIRNQAQLANNVLNNENIANSNTPKEKLKYQRLVFNFYQILLLPIVYSIVCVQAMIPFLTFNFLRSQSYSITHSFLATITITGLSPFLMALVLIIIKKLFIGKFQEGHSPLFSVTHLRFWFYRRIKNAIPLFLFAGTPLMRIMLNALGSSIGKGTTVSESAFDLEDLVSIDSNCCVGSQTIFNNVKFSASHISFSKVKIKSNVNIGSGSVIAGNTIIESYSNLGDLSNLVENTTVPPREEWKGSPAVFSSNLSIAPESILKRKFVKGSLISKSLTYLLPSISILIAAILPTVSLIPVLVLIEKYSLTEAILRVPIFVLLYLATFCFNFFILRWSVLGKLPTGKYEIGSISYLRKWFVDKIHFVSLNVLHPLYASIYLPFWFKLLGAKIGKRAEISTANSLTFHHLNVAEEAFIADNTSLGDSELKDGHIHLFETHIGNRTFVGNSAVLDNGANLTSSCLIGVLSISPRVVTNQNSTWLGSPCFQLPTRQESISLDPSLTFKPSLIQVLMRSLIEGVRIILPTSVQMTSMLILYHFLYSLMPVVSITTLVFLTPFLFFLFAAVPAVLITVILKWLCVGKYKPAEWGLWTSKVWLSEAVTSTYESLAVPLMVEHAKGTPLLPFVLRLLGAKIGKNTYIETTDFTEFDLVTIHDNVIIEDGSGPQTHLFEDRVMKLGTIVLEKNVIVGARSIILYNTKIGENAGVDPLTLIMKGEEIPSNSNWRGIPARSYQNLYKPGNLFSKIPKSESFLSDLRKLISDSKNQNGATNTNSVKES